MNDIIIKEIKYTWVLIEYRNKEYKLNMKHSASHGYYIEFLGRRIRLDLGRKKAEN